MAVYQHMELFSLQNLFAFLSQLDFLCNSSASSSFTHFSIVLGSHACVPANSLQLCLILCDPVDHSPPDTFVHGILQERILEWVAMPSSRGSSWPRDWTMSLMFPSVIGRFFITRATWEACISPVVMYGCEGWTIKKAERQKWMLLNCGVGEDSWESLGLQGDPTSPF